MWCWGVTRRISFLEIQSMADMPGAMAENRGK